MLSCLTFALVRELAPQSYVCICAHVYACGVFVQVCVQVCMWGVYTGVCVCVCARVSHLVGRVCFVPHRS